jgi:hypothetical protein
LTRERVRTEPDLALTAKIMRAMAQARTSPKSLEDALSLIAENVGAEPPSS